MFEVNLDRLINPEHNLKTTEDCLYTQKITRNQPWTIFWTSLHVGCDAKVLSFTEFYTCIKISFVEKNKTIFNLNLFSIDIWFQIHSR